MATPEIVSRFWTTVAIEQDISACWEWLGYIEDGYGRFYDGERMRFAHDLALEWYTGEKRLDELITCHSCNNPGCVNPHHLRFDTPASNVADMMAAGTHRTTKKLSDEQVILIRRRAAAGATGRALAIQYGVSESLGTEILRGRRRPNVGGPLRTTHGNTRRKRHARQ